VLSDLNRIVLGGQIVAVFVLPTIRAIVKAAGRQVISAPRIRNAPTGRALMPKPLPEPFVSRSFAGRMRDETNAQRWHEFPLPARFSVAEAKGRVQEPERRRSGGLGRRSALGER
jgi:hypothetical protein